MVRVCRQMGSKFESVTRARTEAPALQACLQRKHVGDFEACILPQRCWDDCRCVRGCRAGPARRQPGLSRGICRQGCTAAIFQTSNQAPKRQGEVLKSWSCAALQAAAQQALEELGTARAEAHDMQACLQHSQVRPCCDPAADCLHAPGCGAAVLVDMK